MIHLNFVLDLLTVEPHTPSPEPQRYQKNGGDWYSQNNKDTTSMLQSYCHVVWITETVPTTYHAVRDFSKRSFFRIFDNISRKIFLFFLFSTIVEFSYQHLYIYTFLLFIIQNFVSPTRYCCAFKKCFCTWKKLFCTNAHYELFEFTIQIIYLVICQSACVSRSNSFPIQSI